jgi:hypothetical protein
MLRTANTHEDAMEAGHPAPTRDTAITPDATCTQSRSEPDLPPTKEQLT